MDGFPLFPQLSEHGARTILFFGSGQAGQNIERCRLNFRFHQLSAISAIERCRSTVRDCADKRNLPLHLSHALHIHLPYRCNFISLKLACRSHQTRLGRQPARRLRSAVRTEQLCGREPLIKARPDSKRGRHPACIKARPLPQPTHRPAPMPFAPSF